MEMLIFIAGIIIGVVALSFFILVNNCHRTFHEIQWHDAKKEKPTLRVFDKETYYGKEAVRLLVYTSENLFFISYYWPDADFFNFIGRDIRMNEKVLYFAYWDEIKDTIPPCPVCSGAFTDNPFNPYANQSTL